jgi:hypothetical protein
MFIKANYISTAVEARADSVLRSCLDSVRIIAREAAIIMRTRVSGLRKIFGVRSRKCNGALGTRPSNNRYLYNC